MSHQFFPRTTVRKTKASDTSYLVASRRSIFLLALIKSFRIEDTSYLDNLAVCVPCSSLSFAFCLGVVHAKLQTRLSCGSRFGKCRATQPSGRGPTKVSRTRTWSLMLFLTILPCLFHRKSTVRYPPRLPGFTSLHADLIKLYLPRLRLVANRPSVLTANLENRGTSRQVSPGRMSNDLSPSINLGIERTSV